MWHDTTCKQVLDPKQGPVQCLATLDDGALLSGGNDGTVRVWRDGVCVATIAAHQDTVRGMARVGGLGVVTVSHDLTGKVRRGGGGLLGVGGLLDVGGLWICCVSSCCLYTCCSVRVLSLSLSHTHTHTHTHTYLYIIIRYGQHLVSVLQTSLVTQQSYTVLLLHPLVMC